MHVEIGIVLHHLTCENDVNQRISSERCKAEEAQTVLL